MQLEAAEITTGMKVKVSTLFKRIDELQAKDVNPEWVEARKQGVIGKVKSHIACPGMAHLFLVVHQDDDGFSGFIGPPAIYYEGELEPMRH